MCHTEEEDEGEEAEEDAVAALKRAPDSPRAGTKEARTLQPPMRRDPYTNLPLSDEYFENGVRFGANTGVSKVGTGVTADKAMGLFLNTNSRAYQGS